jgi:hybrid cluster-associated redox disulfide protein
MLKKETRINEILQTVPGAREVFNRFGMGCLSCMGAEMETLENGARMHDVDLAELLAALNRLLHETDPE